MNIPADLKYATSHEWVRVEGNEAVVGITDYAQNELTDIVFVELPEVGTEVTAGESICVVESTKVASDIYAPVSGKVTASNADLDASPDLINSSPFENGWLFRVEMTDPAELNNLKTPDEYAELIQT